MAAKIVEYIVLNPILSYSGPIITRDPPFARLPMDPITVNVKSSICPDFRAMTLKLPEMYNPGARDRKFISAM